MLGADSWVKYNTSMLRMFFFSPIKAREDINLDSEESPLDYGCEKKPLKLRQESPGEIDFMSELSRGRFWLTTNINHNGKVCTAKIFDKSDAEGADAAKREFKSLKALRHEKLVRVRVQLTFSGLTREKYFLHIRIIVCTATCVHQSSAKLSIKMDYGALKWIIGQQFYQIVSSCTSFRGHDVGSQLPTLHCWWEAWHEIASHLQNLMHAQHSSPLRRVTQWYEAAGQWACTLRKCKMSSLHWRWLQVQCLCLGKQGQLPLQSRV